MKCECKTCNGEGEIPCPECGGDGTHEGSIETVVLRKTDKNYDDLLELQKDAKRVIKLADRLKIMNPRRCDSYDNQLSATLVEINKQADLAAKRK